MANYFVELGIGDGVALICFICFPNDGDFVVLGVQVSVQTGFCDIEFTVCKLCDGLFLN